MVDETDPAEAALRLERALERIAAAAQGRAFGLDSPGPVSLGEDAGPHVDIPALTQRLDVLIAHVRTALDGGGPA